MANSAVPSPQLLNEPGVLYWAPLGTAEPAHAVALNGQAFTDSWPSPWVMLGATVEGMDFQYNTTVEEIRVAEIFDPIKQVTIERGGSIAFALTSITLENVKKAFNGGTITVTAATASTGQFQSYAPPNPGSEVRAMIGWESTDSSTRIILNQSLNAATLSLAPRRGTGIASIPCEFRMEKPSSAQPFKILTAGTNRA